MKQFLIFIFVSLIFTSCDISYNLIIKNPTSKPVNLHVQTHEKLTVDSVKYTNTLLPDAEIKQNIFSKIDTKIKINIIDSVTYSVIANPGQMLLIEPVFIGYPIEKVWYINDGKEYLVLNEEKLTNNVNSVTKFPRTTIVELRD